MLNLRVNLFFLRLVCCQYFWEYLEVTITRISDLYFLVQVLAKNVTVGNGTSVTGHVFNFHFSLFLTLVSISKVKFCDFISFYEFQQII